ncbi:response regulator [Amycolatopsis sp. CA-230715]|uniref:response regulator n=1 Tax=Amycolatopsis sp. CA-230715 TaxID=2745196 RepID=UPI001C3335C0|nr:response regulator transcription factor [Amycolatopsis sp. CA-230715]QWF85233.1 Oxygen regulatory protein NreC [Amycolatopsis sp. CA-230715]
MSAPFGVLIADDDHTIREALMAVLEEEPDLAVVAVACDADEAIALAREHAPDVAVLDLRMPRGGGEAAARGILECSPATRIMAFSAYDDGETVASLRGLGITDFVLKGAPNTEIIRTVRRLVS